MQVVQYTLHGSQAVPIPTQVRETSHGRWQLQLETHDELQWILTVNGDVHMDPKPSINQSHRIRMYAIYGNIYHQYTPVLLAYNDWILWEWKWIQGCSISMFRSTHGNPVVQLSFQSRIQRVIHLKNISGRGIKSVQTYKVTTGYLGVSINGGAPSHHPFLDGIFHFKPSIWGYPVPPFMETTYFFPKFTFWYSSMVGEKNRHLQS